MDKVHIDFKIISDKSELLLGNNLYLSKDKLFKDFYGAYYDFIKHHKGKNDLLKHNIKTKKDFLDYADYYADEMENCYAMGFSFHHYFLEVEEGGKLETQSDKKFIGYLYQNNKYHDFLNFLVSFFAYWRNDEGCTNFHPYNHADDFFNSSWAALVDTSKLFYFSSETVYHWHSYRIKYLLDHIPGCILDNTLKEKDIIKGIDLKVGGALPKVYIAGYEFLGWFDGDNKVEYVNTSRNLVIKLKRKDYYNYWEKEFNKIPKEVEPTYKKVDPA